MTKTWLLSFTEEEVNVIRNTMISELSDRHHDMPDDDIARRIISECNEFLTEVKKSA